MLQSLNWKTHELNIYQPSFLGGVALRHTHMLLPSVAISHRGRQQLAGITPQPTCHRLCPTTGPTNSFGANVLPKTPPDRNGDSPAPAR